MRHPLKHKNVPVFVLASIVIVTSTAIFINQHRPRQLHPLPYKASSATHLTISRQGVASIKVSNFTLTVSNASAVAILHDIDGFSSVSPGTYNCPNDDGVEYTFKFTSPNIIVSGGPNGCGFMMIDSMKYWSTSKFWNDTQIAIDQSVDPYVGSVR